MKKISLIALALFTSLAMYAQTSEATPMAVKPRFGIKAGVNMANLRANGYATGLQPETKFKTSMSGGIYMNAPLGTGGLSIQPEVVYSGQGSKITSTTGGVTPTTETYEQDFGYINIPIMLQWKSTGGFLVETGPQAGFMISAKKDGPGSASTDNKTGFDTFDFSWGAGLGYLSRVGLGINARYNLGLANIIQDGGGNNSPNDGQELKHKVIQIGLFYAFGAKN